MISREDILSKTHRGITIYAHILRSFYPEETVLSLRGRNCIPARNPYNADKETLSISIVNEIAVHTDSEESIPAGDVFCFAERFFKLSDQELLEKINTELHLRIGQSKSWGNRSQQIDTELLIPKFSYFNKPITNTKPTMVATILNVYQLINGNEFVANTNALRGIKDLKEARSFKAKQFDYVTFSGWFNTRNDKDLVEHSGLMAIDFDHLEDIEDVKEKLLSDAYFETELLFTSPSGDGLKWIIPIELEQVTHQEYFKAVANYVRQTYSLEIDQSGKDISRACFLPHDSTAYINPKYLQQ